MIRAVPIALAILISITVASRAERGITLLGPIPNTCGAWIEERTRNQDRQFWALGFLSGINAARSDSGDFLKGVDSSGIWTWLDNYCRAHPLDDLASAVGALSKELAARLKRN